MKRRASRRLLAGLLDHHRLGVVALVSLSELVLRLGFVVMERLHRVRGKIGVALGEASVDDLLDLALRG